MQCSKVSPFRCSGPTIIQASRLGRVAIRPGPNRVDEGHQAVAWGFMVFLATVRFLVSSVLVSRSSLQHAQMLNMHVLQLPFLRKVGIVKIRVRFVGSSRRPEGVSTGSTVIQKPSMSAHMFTLMHTQGKPRKLSPKP